MGLDPQSIIVALVILHSASGEVIDGNTAITTETIERYRPSDKNASQAREAFINSGFEVGTLNGISFTVSANIEKFNQFFDVLIEENDDNGYVICRDDNKFETFPLDRLPMELADTILTVAFDTPVESFY